MPQAQKDYTVTLYADPTSPTGHFAISIQGPGGKFLTHYEISGKYPQNGLKALNPYADGKIRNDSNLIKNPKTLEHKVYMTKEQALKAAEFVKKAEKSPGNYKLLGDNCIDFVDKALEHAGVKGRIHSQFKPDELKKIGTLPYTAGKEVIRQEELESYRNEHKNDPEPKHYDQGASLETDNQTLIGSSADDILSSHSPEDLAKAQRLSDQMQTAQTVSLNGVEVPLNMPDLYHQDDVRALQAELLQNRNHPQKAAMQDSITAWYKQALPGNIQKDETGRMIPVQTPSRPQNMANLLKDIPAFNQNSQTAADHVKDLTKRANLAKKAKSVPLPGGVSLNKAEKTTTAAQSNVSFENQKEQIINKDKLNTYKMLDQQREATIKKANTPPALETPQLTQSAGANTSTAPQRTPEEQAIFKQEAIKKGSEIGEQLGDAAFNISNGKVLGGLADASRNISEFMPDIKGVNVGNLAADGLDAAQKFKDGDKLGGALSIASGALNAYQSFNSDSPAFKEGLTDKARVICTELHAQGRLDTELYKLDVSFTKRCLSATTVRGYHLWAVPFVKWMRKYPFVSTLVCPVARWRAEEIAYNMGARPKGNYKGMIVRLFGEPICFLLGLLKRETDWKILY
jgi:hypothetical protein